MKNLKEVPADKKKSLGKLPEKVRNKMGYAKQGKMMKARTGVSVDTSGSKIKKKNDERRAKLKKLRDAQVGPAEEAKAMGQMNMGGEMKSTKGYGAARTSGMGLQDENLIPGKSMDYYKDLM
jgi:hypothetical protein